MEAQPSHNTLKFSGFSNDLLTRVACITLPSPHCSCQTPCWPLLHHSSFYFCNLWFPNTALTLQHWLVYLWYRAHSLAAPPRPPCAAIQIREWYNGRRTTVMAFYITLFPPFILHKRLPCSTIRSTAAKWPCTPRFPLFCVWKMANSAFAGVFTGRLGLVGGPFLWYNYAAKFFDKSTLQQDLLTSRFPAAADDESWKVRQVASA